MIEKLGRKNRVGTIKKTAPAVQSLNTEADVSLRLADFNWSDLQFLMAVGETGSIREAARKLSVSVNTARTRLERVEAVAGFAITQRTSRGSSLTAGGQRLYLAAAEFGRRRIAGAEGADEGLLAAGQLRMGCTEGVGTSWLTPRISDLRRRIAPTTIHLEFDYDLQRDRAAEVDIGLTYRQPTSGDFMISKIATIHFMLFAAPEYVRAHGQPATMDDLRDHMFVEQAAPGYNTTVLDLLMGADRPKSTTAIQTNSALTQAYAAASGAGIAILPSYTRAVTSRLLPLALPLNLRVPLYFFYHARARHNPVIRETVDWLRESFEPETYPWFAERFVHPDDFPTAQPKDTNVISLFEHFVDFIPLPVS